MGELAETCARVDGRLLLDLSEVAFIDSSGLRALIGILRDNPTTTLIAVSRTVARILDVTGLTTMFPLPTPGAGEDPHTVTTTP